MFFFCSDIAAGKESVPVPVMNGVDDEGLPKDYIYMAENCEALNVNIDRTMSSLKVRFSSSFRFGGFLVKVLVKF